MSGRAAPELKPFALLADLEEPEREALVDALEELRLEPGTRLFEEGEPGEGLVLVAEGALRATSSRSPEPAPLGPGDALGALSLVASGPREATVETVSRARVLVLRRSAFRRFADAEPRAACGLLEAILRETARLGREALGDVDRLPIGN